MSGGWNGCGSGMAIVAKGLEEVPGVGGRHRLVGDGFLGVTGYYRFQQEADKD